MGIKYLYGLWIWTLINQTSTFLYFGLTVVGFSFGINKMSAGDDQKLFVAVTVTSNINTFNTERRFPLDINIANLKVSFDWNPN